MKLKLSMAISVSRSNLVKLISGIISAGGDFKPYETNKGNNSSWILDADNNWWLRFFDDNPDAFEITYRYQCELVQAEEALASWVNFVIGSEFCHD